VFWSNKEGAVSTKKPPLKLLMFILLLSG